MPSLSEKEYAELLHSNPDLDIVDDGTGVALQAPPDINLNQNPDGSNKFVTLKEPMNREMGEHEDQVILFNFIRALEKKHEVLEYVFAVPNGGFRPKRTARQMKAEGERAGVPDIWVPVPMGSKFGMVIEMKRGYLKKNGTKGSINKPSDDQVRWLNMMADMNWLAFVAYHREIARQLILGYLRLPDVRFEDVLL